MERGFFCFVSRSSRLCKVGARRRLRVRRHAHVGHLDRGARGARDAYVHGVGAEAAGVLEEVVVGPRRLLPRGAAVRADLQRGHALVGVDDLHREPERRRARLAVQHKRRGDAALDKRVRRRDDAGRDGSQLGKRILKQVQVALGALGALVDDL